MMGNNLYTVTIAVVFNTVKTSRLLLVPAFDTEQAHLKVTMYLIDLNWLDISKDDKGYWYISQPLEEIDLLTLMASPGAVRLGKDVDVPFELHVPTPETPLASEEEDDTDVWIEGDPCFNCLDFSCWGCLYWYEQ